MKLKFLFLSLIIIFTGIFVSCKSTKESKKIKVSEKQEVAQNKEAEKQYNKLVEVHHNRQAPKTKMMMGETKKRSEQYNRAKKRNFFQQLFGTKSKHKKHKKKKK